MRGVSWLVLVLAVILVGAVGYFALKYDTIDPCRATARLVQKDCTRFFSDQSCDDLKTMDEDQLTQIIRKRKGYFRCFRELSKNTPFAGE